MTLAELNLHFELRDNLARAQDTLATLRQKALPGAAAMNGMPHAPGVSDKVGNLAAEIADMEASIAYLEAEVTVNEGPVLAFIQSIDDVQIRLIFRLRFIRCLTWAEVASVIGGPNSEESVKKMCYRYLTDD